MTYKTKDGFTPSNREMENVYHKIINTKEEYGKFQKCIFHLHTPASYDYTLFSDKDVNWYKELSDDNLNEICVKERLFPKNYQLNLKSKKDFEKFASKKEAISYLLIAQRLINMQVGLVVISDHNSINGFDKLKAAIKLHNENQTLKIYPEVILGIEINCADKNHIVGIFKDNDNLKKEINKWLQNEILSVQDGTYWTSMQVIEKIVSWGGIPYIAHIDTSDIFKEKKYLSGAYKKKLLNLKCIDVIGLSNKENQRKVSKMLEGFSNKEFNFILDNDSHNLDDISKNIFWIKGKKRNYDMVKSALRDYSISIDYDIPNTPFGFAKGLLIKSGEKGFLKSISDNELCISFSESLNCIIGGRGTGKSTILHIIDFILRQNSANKDNLEFICNHQSVWLLYEYNKKEYMINFYSPIKEYEDDDILKSFSTYRNQKYGYKYYYYPEQVAEYTLKNLINIYELKIQNNKLFSKKILNDKKGDLLNKFFNTKYSINQLVETANDEKINTYIYQTMFKNKTLSNAKKVINVKSLNGLKRLIKNVDDITKQRKQQVEELVNKFNKTQKDILQIVYTQNKEASNILNFTQLMPKKYQIPTGYYRKYNIKNEDIVEYLQDLSKIIGIQKLLLLFFDEKYQDIIQILDIKNYCLEKKQWMFEEEFIIIDDTNYMHLLKKIKNDILNDENQFDIINSLKKYISAIESFDLEFNINSKEHSNSLPTEYKSVRKLSLGQKVVAMLSFILAYSDFSNDFTPLIIDQPEDNLDNQYIYRNLVKQLRDIKSKRQVIIATHNATIVTNAKAEQVIVMESDNKNGWIQKTGYPTEKIIKKHIINYLEGGVSSFKHKCFVYEEILNEDENN